MYGTIYRVDTGQFYTKTLSHYSKKNYRPRIRAKFLKNNNDKAPFEKLKKKLWPPLTKFLKKLLLSPFETLNPKIPSIIIKTTLQLRLLSFKLQKI